MPSCVAVQPPEGGPPDETPPKLVSSFPAEGTVNFKEKTIKFTFDKDIDAKDLHRNLLIMPQLDKPANQDLYSYRIHSNTLHLTLQMPLKADTTYTIHLKDVIIDKHEGTQALPIALTFSTGPSIDWITSQGIAKHLLTNTPLENVNVYLYNAERDPEEWQKKGIP